MVTESLKPQPTDITFHSDEFFRRSPGADLRPAVRREALALLPDVQAAYVLASQHPRSLICKRDSGYDARVERTGYQTLNVATLNRIRQENSLFPKPYFLDCKEGTVPTVMFQNNNAEDLAIDYFERAGEVINSKVIPPRFISVRDALNFSNPSKRKNHVFHVLRDAYPLDEINVFTSFMEKGEGELNERNCPGVVALFVPRKPALAMFDLLREKGNYYHVLTSLFSRLFSPIVTPKINNIYSNSADDLQSDSSLRKSFFSADPWAIDASDFNYSVKPYAARPDWITLIQTTK